MTFTRTQTQTLADGTHISTVTHETFYYDSRGRTRMDVELPLSMQAHGPRYAVMVRDPVARFSLTWQIGAGPNISRQFTSLDLDTVTHRSPLQQLQHDAGEDAPPPRLQRAPAETQSAERPKPNRSTQNLGTDQVAGFSCESSRLTTVYPAGAMGNDRDIATTSERCLSREFGRTLREVVQDPRSGTYSLILQSLTRGEPDPMVFHPPADYVEKSQTP